MYIYISYRRWLVSDIFFGPLQLNWSTLR